MFSRIFGVFVATLMLGAWAHAAVKLTLNVKDGDVVSGDFTFKVKVESEQLVTQVEFYVGDDLRESDSSTPYEFKLDTLSENEGDLKVTFAAYTSEGDNAKKSVTVRIDNGVSAGSPALTSKATEALSNSKWDEAILYARAALKAKAGDPGAQLVLARAYYGKNVLDSAQKYCEDVLTTEPNNVQALNLLSAISLQKAFNTYNRGGDREETLKVIDAAFRTAVTSRNKVLALKVDGFSGPISDDNRLKYADICIEAGRYSLAIDALIGAALKNTADPAIADRLIYAMLRAGRNKDAGRQMEIYLKGNNVDALGHALNAIILASTGDLVKSQNEMKEALLSDSENMGVRTANAYLALRRNDSAALTKIAVDLAKDAGQLPVVNYYLSTVYNQIGEYELSRQAAEKTLLAEPSCYDMFIQMGNKAINIALNGKFEEANKAKSIQFQYDTAMTMFQAALAAKPESVEALTGLASLYLLQKKTADALKYSQAAVAASPEYGGAHYALSCALLQQSEVLRAAHRDAEASKIAAEAQKSVTAAGKCDTAILQGRPIPGTDGKEVWKYFNRYGQRPYLSVPG